MKPGDKVLVSGEIICETVLGFLIELRPGVLIKFRSEDILLDTRSYKGKEKNTERP